MELCKFSSDFLVSPFCFTTKLLLPNSSHTDVVMIYLTFSTGVGRGSLPAVGSGASARRGIGAAAVSSLRVLRAAGSARVIAAPVAHLSAVRVP